jgi:mannose-6-phosphate isomerase-like protein (cupin superfamily)
MIIPFPAKMVHKDHVWGRYAEFLTTNKVIFRLIEVGKGGSTSLHRHSKMKEVYLVIKGTLAVDLGEDPQSLQKIIITKGKTLTIHPGTWHRAHSINGSSPVYIEKVTGTLDANDIGKHVPAIAATEPTKFI